MKELFLIDTLQITGDSFLLNGEIKVPKIDGNKHYELIKIWLADGNIPEPDFNEYVYLRKNEYDKLNQFELIYNDAKNGTSTFLDSIDSIKLKHPKPKKKKD